MALQTTTKKRLSPTVTYLLAALAVACPASLAVFAALPSWRQGVSLVGSSLAAIHITILGFMLTVMFGVLYQIVPIAFQAPPLPRHVYTWHLPIHLVAVTGMIYGFFQMNYATVGCFGSLLILSTIAYFIFVSRSYLNARNQTFVHKQMVWPISALLGVMVLGAFQAFAPDTVTPHILLSHVLLGGLGFWGGLVLVISYKLIPMFSLSHGYKARLTLVSGFYFGAVGMDLLGQITDEFLFTIVGLLGTAVALLAFAVDMGRILKARKRKRIVLPLKEALFALIWTIIGQYWVLLSWSTHNVGQALIASFVFVFGGLIPMMLAYMQKIVPFLWFEYRFSKSRDRKTAPLIDDMVPKRPAATGIGLYYLGTACASVYLLLPASASERNLKLLSTAACLAWIAGILLLLYAFIKVVRLGGPRPADDQPASPSPRS